MKYTVRRTWLVHESGSKFHQSFEIAQAGPGRGVTIFHFGAMAGDHTPFRRPVNGGQVQIKSAGRYRSQVAKKKSEGYSENAPFVERESAFAEKEEFENYLRIEFGTNRANEILIKMDVPIGDAPQPEFDPEEGREDTPIDKFAGRPAAWGSW